jgi:hypothetical protein
VRTVAKFIHENVRDQDYRRWSTSDLETAMTEDSFSMLMNALVIEPQGGKVLVVPREAWEAAERAVGMEIEPIEEKDAAAAGLLSVAFRYVMVRSILAALFAPGTVRVAKAVGRAAVFYRDGSDVWLPYDHGDSTDPDSRYIVGVTDGGRTTEATGDPIAILEPEPGKEGA